MLNVNEEYAVALLKLMATLPAQQAPLKVVQEKFEKRYREQIPAAKFRKTQSGRIKWVEHFLWSRYMLTNLGLLDSPARGIWRLSVHGQSWLDEHPTATRIENDSVERLDSEEGRARQNHERRRTEVKAERENASQTWVAESSNPLDGRTEILEREIEIIRAFLEGRNDTNPSEEKKCDWVNFCYTLEMYAEGRDLFRLIDNTNKSRMIGRCANETSISPKSKSANSGARMTTAPMVTPKYAIKRCGCTAQAIPLR